MRKSFHNKALNWKTYIIFCNRIKLIPRTSWAVSRFLGSGSSIFFTRSFALSDTIGQGSLLKSITDRMIACATPCSVSACKIWRWFNRKEKSKKQNLHIRDVLMIWITRNFTHVMFLCYQMSLKGHDVLMLWITRIFICIDIHMIWIIIRQNRTQRNWDWFEFGFNQY